MIELEILIEILQISVEKHGDKPLTNGWLLNIMKLVQRRIESDEHSAEMAGWAVDSDHQ